MSCSDCGSHRSYCTYEGEWCAICGHKYEGELLTYYEPDCLAAAGKYSPEQMMEYRIRGAINLQTNKKQTKMEIEWKL